MPELITEEIVIASEDEKEDPTNVIVEEKGESQEITVEESIAKYETNETSLGIDVSTWNGNINWKKVKESGINFAMIRIGFRGYETGKIMMDNRFYENILGAISNKINVGVYFFSAAINEEEAKEEAEWVLNIIKDYDISYPIAFDVEIFGNREDTRLHGISDKKMTDITMSFVNTISASGYTPMIYSYYNAFNNRFEVGKFGNTRIWLAHYTEQTNYQGNYHMWQYTSDGEVPGIEGRTDMNISYFSVTDDVTKKQEVTGVNSEAGKEDLPFIEVEIKGKMLTSTILRTSPSITVPNKAGEIKEQEIVTITGVYENFVRIIYNNNTYYIEDINNIKLDPVAWKEFNINKKIKLKEGTIILTRPYFFLESAKTDLALEEVTLIAKNDSYLKVSYEDNIYYIYYSEDTYTYLDV